ncbi:hypothetical protein BVRB_8g182600 [Beta vulgaris subsp. vulgaris]|uniref:uncharacterized protein LOC104900631 n=1 Tax=Beta vulgaris subsp. vulgaris TaxID=3555 RepID=UPI00054021A0|nr:uncharacterized protein LOC104900631 [Beta vulgaris subsp. vulgaris]KMT04604.1 hypothetical protein BVRB_8g182600 [Beta vulgaris subsp. vulgaris]
MENRERGIGWPLGLGNMYMRLRMVERMAADRRSSMYLTSSSFSSFTSSNLDTESSASFFQDNSKSLARLIGIRPRHRRSEFYSRNTVDHAETPPTSSTSSTSQHPDELDMKMCDGICIPLCTKMSKNKEGSKR